MSNDEPYDNYVEALSALSAVENRQRDALRKAVEASTAAENRAKSLLADQQRMYDRARQDALDAERLLAGLRSMLGLPREANAASSPRPGTPPRLVQIRAEIREIAQWATESTSTAESLLRTRERLTSAPKPAPQAPSPGTGEQAPRAEKLRVARGVAVAVLVVIATLAVIVLAIA